MSRYAWPGHAMTCRRYHGPRTPWPGHARRKLLTYLVAELTNEGVDHLIIESQDSALDGRDRNTILKSFQVNSTDPAFTYGWRTKDRTSAVVRRRARGRYP